MNKTVLKNKKRAAQSKRHINSRLLNRQITRLKEHLQRIASLEVVLTVVGTMKAGKSTCINAIVGREILPNRNRPMTCIPTLVRHKKGREKPVLHFTNTLPIQRLIGKLGTALKRISEIRTAAIASDKDLAKLATKIRRGFTLKEYYRGETEIFLLLKSINDLVRLAEVFNIDFPFEAFTELQSFPLIEVEFANIAQSDVLGHKGSFALLDTPGFNEAGQSLHLRKIVHEQLQQANAVLAVVDYTQLKSESEAELIEELRKIADITQGRTFALINKFDSKGVHSDNAAETIEYVSNILLDGIIAKDRIFPVSGNQALLAQRARTEMRRTQNLNWIEGKSPDWRDDFGRLAFGSRYACNMNDNDAIHQAIEDLWTSSMFDKPLSKIVQYSQVSALKFAVDSTLEQLQVTADLLGGDDEVQLVKMEYL
jgi:GTPase SAR1 family protein